MADTGWEEKLGNYCLGIEFQFYEVKRDGDDGGDGCTRVSGYLIPLNLKMVKTVNFILSVLYHSKKNFLENIANSSHYHLCYVVVCSSCHCQTNLSNTASSVSFLCTTISLGLCSTLCLSVLTSSCCQNHPLS